MKKKVIITGVDGLLGGKITKRILNHTDLSILGLTMGLDRPKDMMVREGIEASDRLCFMVNEEFLDPGTVIKDIYGAVHLAFSRRVHPPKDIATSIDFAAAVFHRLVDLGVDRVINMSSQGIYGNTREIRKETTPPAPQTHYTMAKYAAEVLFKDIMRNVEHHTNLRLDPVAQSQNVVKGLCKSALQGTINLKGGKQVFSFIDANDVSSAVVAMLTAEGKWAEVYNVGWNRKRYTLVELADLISDTVEECGFKRPQIHLIEDDTVLWTGMDSSRFMEKTGWRPQIELMDTLSNMMRC